MIMSTTFLLTMAWVVFSVQGGPIEIANYSFEIPVLDPDAFPASPVAPFWIELDLDPEYSSNTGIFKNQPPNSPAGDHIVNVDGDQLAFLKARRATVFYRFGSFSTGIQLSAAGRFALQHGIIPVPMSRSMS